MLMIILILDCPPYLTGTTNAGLIAADSVLIPIVPGKLSIASVKRMVAHINTIREQYNPELKIEGIFLTMYEYNTIISRLLLKKNCSGIILNTL